MYIELFVKTALQRFYSEIGTNSSKESWHLLILNFAAYLNFSIYFADIKFFQ